MEQQAMSQSSNENNVRQEFGFDYPDEIQQYYFEHGEYPSNFEYYNGLACWLEGEKYFIHTRVVLPLKAFHHGVGFGLWVEIPQEACEEFLALDLDSENFPGFKTKGKLANQWPPFENMLGANVVVRIVFKADKPYITQVLEVNDMMLTVMIQTSLDNQERIDQFYQVVLEYMDDQNVE